MKTKVNDRGPTHVFRLRTSIPCPCATILLFILLQNRMLDNRHGVMEIDIPYQNGEEEKYTCKCWFE